jgi:receptor protein-tyrosine kinase
MLQLAQLPVLAQAAWARRRSRRVRGERELLAAIGNPLLAARPSSSEALDALCRQLMEHWFGRGRTLLPLVSLRAGDGRSSLAVELARRFAALGERTLLIDADLRVPSLHARFGVPNARGLADLLDGRDVQPVAINKNGGSNLAFLAAGKVREDPLELLSRRRLRDFLAGAARPFRVLLVDTPAAERGPDLEMFAALASGALLIVRPGEDGERLAGLWRRLARCAAVPVATVFNHR